MIGKLLGQTQIQTTALPASYQCPRKVRRQQDRGPDRRSRCSIFSAAQCGRVQKFLCVRSRRGWRSLKLFERFFDEAERVGILNQGPDFPTIQTGRDFGIDLEFQGHLAAGKGRELLDDSLDNLMDIPRRTLR